MTLSAVCIWTFVLKVSYTNEDFLITEPFYCAYVFRNFTELLKLTDLNCFFYEIVFKPHHAINYYSENEMLDQCDNYWENLIALTYIISPIYLYIWCMKPVQNHFPVPLQNLTHPQIAKLRHH